jgi:hypothetical protein
VVLRITNTLTVTKANPEIARLLALMPDQAKKMKCFKGERWVQFVPGLEELAAPDGSPFCNSDEPVDVRQKVHSAIWKQDRHAPMVIPYPPGS